MAIMSATALLASGCGRSDDTAADSDGTTAPDGATTAPSTPTSSDTGPGPGEFGDLGQVCGPAPEGETLEATDVGVTADSIQIGTIADPGYAGRPGLNQEIFDTAEAFSMWCNEAGGINGRKIEVKLRDAKLTEYQPRMIDACDEGDFMLVGGGGVFDDQGQPERLACGLPNLGGFITSPQAVEADLSMTPVPNDSETVAMGDMLWLQEQFPEATKKVAILTAGVAATLNAAKKAEEAMASLGWEVVYSEKYNPAGEASWRGFAEGMKSAGVRGVIWVADPGNLAALLKSMAEIEFHPDFVRGSGNLYDDLLLAEAGPAAEDVYIFVSNYPFLDPELAAQNPATQQYLDVVDEFDPGGKVANLGLTAFSAWLLFAQAATSCGVDLTRDCAWASLDATTEWSGGGLHARQDLSSGRASECFLEMEVNDGEFVLAEIETNEGLFNCSPENVIELSESLGEGVKCENPDFADDPKPSNCAP